MACGGVFGNIYQEPSTHRPNMHCLMLGQNLRWNIVESPLLHWPRNQSAHAHYSKSGAWITGGADFTNYKFATNKTETLDENGTSLGPELPYPMADHCMVYIGEDVFFMAGGFAGRFQSPTKTSFLQNRINGRTKSTPPMVYPRAGHSCLLMEMPEQKDIIVIAAGGGPTQVETFSFKEKTWNLTHQDFCKNGVCNKIKGAQAVSTAASVSLLFGGFEVDSGQPSSKIFQLMCPIDRFSCCKIFFPITFSTLKSNFVFRLS